MPKMSISLSILATSTVLIGMTGAGQREIAAAATAIAEDLAATPTRSLAVVDFTDLQGNVTELGRFVAEEMALGLATSRKGLAVVDRTHLKVLIEENKLGASGVIDPATARKLGQVAGVEALVTGTITPFAESVRVVVKVLDAETARLIAATSVDMAKSRTIEELLARDIRGPDNLVSRSADGGPDLPSAVGSAIFQNDRIRVTVTQLAVAPDNSRATISLAIENTSREALLLGIEGGYGDARVALSDDRGTLWIPRDAKGVYVASQMNDLSRVKDADLTPLGPSDRINLILVFVRGSGGRGGSEEEKPGSTFTVAVNGLISLGSGSRRLSIGITGIKPTVQAR